MEQEYLLYVRYSTIPIEPEPFSESNSKDTFEVSAKPYLKGKIKKDKLQLPRAPLEHLQTLYWLDHLVQHSSAYEYYVHATPLITNKLSLITSEPPSCLLSIFIFVSQ